MESLVVYVKPQAPWLNESQKHSLNLRTLFQKISSNVLIHQ